MILMRMSINMNINMFLIPLKAMFASVNESMNYLEIQEKSDKTKFVLYLVVVQSEIGILQLVVIE